MIEGWKEVTIGDLGKVITGNTPPKNEPANYGGSYPFIKPTDMDIDRRHVTKWEEYYSDVAFKRYKNSYISPKATGVVTIGTVGEKIFQADQYCFTNQSVNVIIPNKNKYDEDFIYYLLKVNLPKVSNANPGTASGRHHVSKSNFCAIKLKLPESQLIQQKIASILSAYDDLIENNLKRIKLLEEMAQQTYEEWFVRMRFPGYEDAVINEGTGLPEGWAKYYFKDSLNFKTGKLDSNALDETGIYDFYTCAKEIYKTNTFCFDGEAVLLGGNNATGDFSLFYGNSKFDAYQRTYIITSKIQNLPLAYVFYVIKSYLSHFKIVSAGASTKFLTMRILDNTKITLPNYQILEKYNQLIKPAFDNVIILKNQNHHLKEARNILLPRLMNGMVEV